MKSGLKPIKRDIRDRDFHRTFGSVSQVSLPSSFSIDAEFPMPDQEADGLPNGCTGYAQADLCQDEDLIVFSPKAIYDQTLAMEGNAGNYTVGCDIRDSLKATILYFGRGGYYNVQPLDSWAHGIQSTLFVNQLQRRAISVGTPWLPEFEFVGPDGIVPDDFVVPTNWTEGHNWTIPEWSQKNGQTYFTCKSWQGKRVGDNGKLYFSEIGINKLLSIPNTGAFTVSKAQPLSIQTIKVALYERVISILQEIALLLTQRSN